MNDEELPVRAEVASAYLDGELDVDERAVAAADPETMALIESFSVVHEALAQVEPAPLSARSAALSAALAEFDAQRAAAAPVAQAPAVHLVTALRRRRERAYRIFLGAAAAAVVAVVAVAALTSTNGGDDMKSSSATAAPEAAGAPADTERKLSAPAAATEAPSVLTENADAVPEIDTAEALAQYASRTAADDATSAQPAAGGAPAATAAEAEATPSPQSFCTGTSDTFLGPISVLGEPAFAVRDTSTGEVRAVSASDCRVLFTVGP